MNLSLYVLSCSKLTRVPHLPSTRTCNLLQSDSGQAMIPLRLRGVHVGLSVSGSIGRQNGELGGSVRRMWSLVPRKRGGIIRVLSTQGKFDMSTHECDEGMKALT